MAAHHRTWDVPAEGLCGLPLHRAHEALREMKSDELRRSHEATRCSACRARLADEVRWRLRQSQALRPGEYIVKGD